MTQMPTFGIMDLLLCSFCKEQVILMEKYTLNVKLLAIAKEMLSTYHSSILWNIYFSGAVLYYYFYKRTALKLADPRYYQDSEWIRREFEKRR